MFMGKKLGNSFSFTHQLMGGISDHNLGNAGASVVVGANNQGILMLLTAVALLMLS
jgi:hypothetical protein